jgi:hypothetical protein
MPSRGVADESFTTPPPILYHAQTGGYAKIATQKSKNRFLEEVLKMTFSTPSWESDCHART